MDCLTKLVGLSQNDCECIDNKPEGYNESLSGFFIDNKTDGIPLLWTDSVTDCGEGGVWDVLNESRQNAINEFITDFGSYLVKENVRMYADWKGLIGQPKRNNTLLKLEEQGFSGVHVESKHVIGSVYVINSISFHSSTATGTTNLHIIDEEGNAVTDPIEFVITAGSVVTHEFDEPLVLPLTDVNTDCKDYFITFDMGDLSGNPKDIKKRSACCGRRPKYPYLHLADVHGFTGIDTLDQVPDTNQNTVYTYGLSINGEFRCSMYDWMCNEVSANLSNFMRVVSKTLQLYAINGLITKILNSDKINRYTLLKREELYGKRNHNNKEIKDRLLYLSQNVPYEKVHCMACGSGKGMKKTSIRI